MASALEASASAPARCRLFGAFLIDAQGRVIRLRSRRARALVAYLLLAGPAGASRERLSGLLWSDRGEEQARASLRQCLLELRRELGEAGIDVLEIGRESVAIHGGLLSSDLAELSAAMEGQDGERLAAALREIGPGELLEDVSVAGLFFEWLSRTRAQIDSAIERQVHHLIAAAEGARAWDALRDLAEAYLLRRPTDEVVAAAAIRADMAMGVTSSAHRRFRALERTLATEYGLRPGLTVSQALEAPRVVAREGFGTLAAEPAVFPVPPPTAEPPRQPPTPSIDQAPPIVVVAAFEGFEVSDPLRNLVEVVRDEVISGLSRFRDLSVATDPNPAMQLSASDFAEPHLVFTLSARVRHAGRGLTVQLTRLQTRSVAWSDSFDIPDTGILTATDLIVARVVGAILPSIDLHLTQPQRGADLGGAYLRYLHASRRAVTADTHDEGLAVAADLEAQIRDRPQFVLPYLPLAYLYNTDFNNTEACSSDGRYRERALELAKRAISLDRGHAHGYSVAGWCYLRLRQWEPALSFFEQALTRNPFNAARLMEVGYGLLFLNELDRARELLNQCLLVNPTPFDGYFTDLGLLELISRNHDRAAAYFELVATPWIWRTLFQAVNLEVSDQGSEASSNHARAAINAIWPKDRAQTPERITAWILAHNPFRSPEVETWFITATLRMLDRASIPPAPGSGAGS